MICYERKRLAEELTKLSENSVSNMIRQIHDTKKKANLKTFTDLNKKIKVKAYYNQSVVLKLKEDCLHK